MRRTRRATVCWILAVVMAVSPLVVYAQQPAGAEAGQAERANRLDLSYVPPGAALVAVAHPRRVLTAPEMEMLPIEVMSAAGKKELGIDPLDVQQVMVIAEPPQPGSPPGVGVVVRFSKPYEQDRILAPLRERTVDGRLDGKTYRRGLGPMDASIFMPDDRTLIVATDATLRKMVANHNAPVAGPIARLLGEADASHDFRALLAVEPLRPLAAMQLATLPLPPEFAGVRQLPELLSAVEVEVNLTGDLEMALILRARNEAAAEQLGQLVDQSIAAAKQMMPPDMAEMAASDDPVEQAMAQYMKRVNERMLEALRPTRTGDRLELRGGGEQNMQIATTGVLIALLLPAIQAARAAARRAASMNNLRQIGRALQNHGAAHKALPPRASFDDNGRPLLSWRVHLLPYLEERELFERFRLDEPWDSPHNRKLIPLMPDVYRSPASTAEPNKTIYLAPVGEGTAFQGRQGLKLGDLPAGSPETVIVLEANDERAVIWTKPDDWPYDPQQPTSGLGEAHPGGFSALLVDGSVHFLAKDIDPAVFRSLLTVAAEDP